MNALPVPGRSPWSPQQRRWLQALGHVVYRAAADADAEAPAPAEAQAAAEASAGTVSEAAPRLEPSPPAHDARAAPRRGPQEPALADPGRESRGPVQAAPPRRAARLPDRLQLAMLRASGLDPADPSAQAAMAQWPVDALRGDAAAKRAFWPQLRALRRP